MAWRAGAELFREIWPLILKYESEGNFRLEFTTDLLALFLGCDVDPSDLRGLHPEVDQALRILDTRSAETDGNESSHEA